MSNAPDLTATSYAILGLLAIKPWTTYELAQQMQRALGQFWPRAESKLYEEPKKLVAHGMAEARSETVGKRPRTVYSITPTGTAGPRGMGPRAWRQPGAGVRRPDQGLLRRARVEGRPPRSHRARPSLARGTGRHRHRDVRGYLEGRGPFPERLPWLILTGRFLLEFDEAVGRWADWAAEVVEAWPDDISVADPDSAGAGGAAARCEAVVHRAAERRGLLSRGQPPAP